MSQFIEIMHPKLRFIDGVEVTSPRPNNDEAEALLEKLVRETLVLNWRVGDRQFEKKKKRIVVGVATWSGYDLRLMDELAAVSVQLEKNGTFVEIFNADRVGGTEGINEIVPGLGKLLHYTPFVGVWKDGEQIASGQGFAGRELITEYIQQYARP